MSTASSVISDPSSSLSDAPQGHVSAAHCSPPTAHSPCSPARLAANRQNAQKSTGPSTPQGKSISSQNATTHGLRSSTLHLARISQLEPSLRADLNPQGPLQEFLFQRLLSLAARLDTLHEAEESLFSRLERTRLTTYNELKSCNANRWAAENPHLPGPAETLADYLTHTDDPILRLHHLEMRLQRTFHSTLKQFRDLQKAGAENKNAPNEPTGIPAKTHLTTATEMTNDHPPITSVPKNEPNEPTPSTLQ